MPISNIDVNLLQILVEPRTISVELRTASERLENGLDTVKPLQKIELDHPIRERNTTVLISGSGLRMRCEKALPNDNLAPWREMIRFNTRAPVGCI